MNNRELIDKLKQNIEDWNEQARSWEELGKSKQNTALAKRCRAKAEQWAEVIKVLERDSTG